MTTESSCEDGTALGTQKLSYCFSCYSKRNINVSNNVDENHLKNIAE